MGPQCRPGAPRRRHSGFTLIELLVVIGLIVVLISILMPAMSRVRAESRVVVCASNLRQLYLGVLAYSTDNRQRYPTNLSAPRPGQLWYDENHVGRYVPAPPINVFPDRTVYACPSDDGARRSYAMNVWASSKTDPAFLRDRTLGVLWPNPVRNASEMILLAEAWSYQGYGPFGWEAPPTIGYAGTCASQRFGGLGGIRPIYAGRWGLVNCELPFMRHRTGPGHATEPVGRVNLCFADGHVSLVSNQDLVNPETGTITGLALWSPVDEPPIVAPSVQLP